MSDALWYETETPQSVYEAQCYAKHLRQRVRAGEAYGRGLKALLSRIGEWFDLSTFHPTERLESIAVARSRFHTLWGRLYEGIPYDRLDDDFEWLALWFERVNDSTSAAADNPHSGRALHS